MSLKLQSGSRALQIIPPGLQFIPHFLNRNAQPQILGKILDLHRHIEQKAKAVTAVQPSWYLPRHYNLAQQHFKHIRFQEAGKSLDSHYFEEYGEEGNTLTYFQRTNNIPTFVQEALIAPLERLKEVQALKKQGAFSEWNFTFNTYTSRDLNRTGFDFHKDTPMNGKIAAIFMLSSEADIEMRPAIECPISYAVTLTPGSLFLLSGDARCKWLHQILSRKVKTETPRRITLVLGMQR